jgi:anti-anti-sigma factor
MTAIRVSPLSTESFELCVDRVQPCGAWLRASGELDLAAASRLAEILERERSQGHRFVRLDVSGVTFLDAHCLAAMVRAHQALISAHGLLILIGVDAHLEHLLKITHLDQTFFYMRSPEDRSEVRR